MGKQGRRFGDRNRRGGMGKRGGLREFAGALPGVADGDAEQGVFAAGARAILLFDADGEAIIVGRAGL